MMRVLERMKGGRKMGLREILGAQVIEWRRLTAGLGILGVIFKGQKILE